MNLSYFESKVLQSSKSENCFTGWRILSHNPFPNGLPIQTSKGNFNRYCFVNPILDQMIKLLKLDEKENFKLNPFHFRLHSQLEFIIQT